MNEEKKPAYLVSACLCGERCRYDGGCTPDKRIIALKEAGLALSFCPEAGIGTPREPCELTPDGHVISRSGRDFTQAFQKGGEKALELCRMYEIKKAVLKERSPSCGVHRVYDGSFSGRQIAGMGLTARLLSENGIDVMSEEDDSL